MVNKYSLKKRGGKSLYKKFGSPLPLNPTPSSYWQPAGPINPAPPYPIPSTNSQFPHFRPLVLSHF